MLPRTISISACTVLSLVNVVAFFVIARYAEALGFVGADAITSFSVSIGMLTMFVTGALLIWAAVDHFLIEPTSNTAFAVSVNLGFLCAFVMM
jgi:cytosine/uracil/thiamine/allantoin permease